MSRKACLPPIVGANTRLLILGSLPGEASLASARYYAHPQNQFWRLLGDVLNLRLFDLPYSDRLTALLERGIGLWDTIAEAVRPGSLDTALRDIAPNDLAALAATLPELRAVGFNGNTAAKLGRRALASTSLRLIDLPSSSPAYTRPYAEKLAVWQLLRDVLT